MHAARRQLVSEEDFLALPETMDKVELIDGEVFIAPSPTVFHQEILGRLVASLRNWAPVQPRPVFVGQSPLDVRFGPDRILQPDAFVILGAVPFDRAGPLDIIPDSASRSPPRTAATIA